MYRVGVIGLGNIAAMYANPQASFPYCHVGGIRHSDRVELVAVADLSEQVRERFQQTWGSAFPDSLQYYGSDQAMLAAEQLDIVAVCVRGPYHFPVMMNVIAAAGKAGGPRAIFLEKPPTCSLQEMDTMLAAAQAVGVPVTVSYSRHWAPHVLRLQELVANGLVGEVRQVVGYCGHSFLSFASHTTDLICQFAGYDPVAVYARGHVREQAVPDGYEPEPDLDAMVIEFPNGVIGTQVGAQASHGSFYAEVLGTQGGARVGIYIPPAVWDKDGHPIDLEKLAIPENASVFKVAYDQIAQYLDGGPLPDCTNAQFAAVHEIGFAGIESVLTGQRIALPNQNRTRKIHANG